MAGASAFCLFHSSALGINDFDHVYRLRRRLTGKPRLGPCIVLTRGCIPVDFKGVCSRMPLESLAEDQLEDIPSLYMLLGLVYRC